MNRGMVGAVDAGGGWLWGCRDAMAGRGERRLPTRSTPSVLISKAYFFFYTNTKGGELSLYCHLLTSS